MKTKSTSGVIFLLMLMIFSVTGVMAQNLWSAAFLGGTNNAGTILQMNADGSGFTKFYDFNEANGSSPMGSVLQASNGKVYATCVNGGQDSSCVIYCYDPATLTYTNLYSFDIIHGDFPMSGLVEVPGGLLYGMASAGGAANAGVVYNYNTTTNTYTDLYELDSTNGFSPCGKPLLAGDGKLYGMLSGYDFYSGYVQPYGGIYRYDIGSNTFTNLYNFTGVNDGYAFGSLVEHNGLFYGMCSGIPQYAPMIMADAFNFFQPLYPAVNQGNIFSFDPATLTYTSLHSFDSLNGGAPYGTLLMAADGKFYGVTSAGGANGAGVLFSFDLTGNVYTKLYDFTGATGAVPMSDLMQSTDGNLYGSTTVGGANNLGVAYRFNPITKVYSVVTDFDETKGGATLGGAFSVVNNSTVGILTPVVKPLVEVYPVPAHNSITVSIENAGNEAPVLTLTDANGRVVWGPQPQVLNGSQQVQLNLSAIESGVYFLTATTGDNVVVKKIVRQ